MLLAVVEAHVVSSEILGMVRVVAPGTAVDVTTEVEAPEVIWPVVVTADDVLVTLGAVVDDG